MTLSETNTIDAVRVPLTRGKSALVDAADAVGILCLRWCATQIGKTWYAMRALPRTSDGKRRFEYLHRRILGDVPGMVVDHINRDGLDCRRANLRHVTHSENLANQGVSRGNRSGFKGVSWDRQTGRWGAHIQCGGRSERIGRFATAEDAARAYDRRARECFGEAAGLNFTDQ